MGINSQPHGHKHYQKPKYDNFPHYDHDKYPHHEYNHEHDHHPHPHHDHDKCKHHDHDKYPHYEYNHKHDHHPHPHPHPHDDHPHHDHDKCPYNHEKCPKGCCKGDELLCVSIPCPVKIVINGVELELKLPYFSLNSNHDLPNTQIIHILDALKHLVGNIGHVKNEE